MDENGSPLNDRFKTVAGGNLLYTLIAIALIALLIRLLFLGERVAHFDEGRVAYDTIRYSRTGLWEYRPIVHGPFLPHVNHLVFWILGPSDFTMRLVVAIVGGLLPLSVWLFRRHFSKTEAIAIAVFLAACPILVYYSRFMRNDVLVGAFALVALGMVVRFYDARNVRYLYGASAFLALSFTAKENAIVYVLCFAGAGSLMLAHTTVRAWWNRGWNASLRVYADRMRRLRNFVVERARRAYRFAVDYTKRARRVATHVSDRLLRRGRSPDGARGTVWLSPNVVARLLAWTRESWRSRGAVWYGVHLCGVPLLWVAIIVVFYAPRTGGAGVGFERLFTDPTLTPAVTEQALGDFWGGITDWGDKADGGDGDLDATIEEAREYFSGFLTVLATYAAGLIVFAGAGIASEVLFADRRRPFALFFAYWGLVSVPGYAVGMDIFAAWGLVHALIPLAFPAGIALALVADWGVGAYHDRDTLHAALSVLVVVLLLGSMGTTIAGTSFDLTNAREAGERHMVQYAQPEQDVRETLTDVQAIVEVNGGGPILFYGDPYDVGNENAAYRPPVRNEYIVDENGNRVIVDNGNWYKRLPLPWYYEVYGAEPESARTLAELSSAMRQRPPVVVTSRDNENLVDQHANGYAKRTHYMRSPGDQAVFYLRRDLLDRAWSGSS